MSTINNQDRKANLALAMAGGTTVIDWARDNSINERTAYRWARSPEVIEQIEIIRRESLDRAINRLSQQAINAADEIARLARKASSESVRLQAARAVLSELMAVSSFATLERRMTEIERRLREDSLSSGAPRHAMTAPGEPANFTPDSPSTVDELGD